MFEDLELGELTPVIIIYIVVTIMMWYIFGYWENQGLELGWIKKIGFQIILAPLCYFIVNYYKNKE